MKKIKKFQAALYLRLSRDDAVTEGLYKTESGSISYQRQMLTDYAKKHDDIEIFEIYTDDGYSGTDFDRPGFQRMIKDIYDGNVNCIIVKDLSRFGRDYIEAGRYIQKTFPAFNVRFIAVADDYDSLYADRMDKTLLLPVKNFINDSYCRDISVKVRTHQRLKMMEGKCICAFAVYGYRKDSYDRNKLVIDEYVSEIVRDIFIWKMQGYSLGRIAQILNERGILSPSEYKKMSGTRYSTGFETAGVSRWAAQSVKRILADRVYIGSMEQGKREKISYKINKSIAKPQQEWIKVKNTHEAVISERDYNIVKELSACNGRRLDDTDRYGMFCGILMCADCGKPMIRRVCRNKSDKKIFYICGSKNRCTGCSRHSIEENTLENIISELLRCRYDSGNIPAVRNSYVNESDICGKKISAYKEMLKMTEDEHVRCRYMKNTLSEDLDKNVIDKDEYTAFYSMYDKRCEELLDVIKKQKEYIKRITSKNNKTDKDIFSESGRLLTVLTVSKIYVHEGRMIDVFFRFKGLGKDVTD